MRFRELEKQVEGLPAFNLNDVRKLDPGFHRQQLSYWLDKGYIKPVAGGYYLLADQEVDEGYLFTVANKIYNPSYISLESALAYYNVIPETVLQVTSVSSRKTKEYESLWGIFRYRHVKPVYMFGYQVVEKDQKRKYNIAFLEKAVLDYLYLNPKMATKEEFEGQRWNKEIIKSLSKDSHFDEYLKIFRNKALERRAEKMWEYSDA